MAQGTNLFTSHEARILAVNAGSEEQPIYFTGGEPTATSYALKATVNNGDAKYVAYYSNERLIASSKPTYDMRMPAHYYHNLYEDNPTEGTTVFVHYYNTDTTSTNTFANLRVKAGSSFKTFVFGGDGNCSWEGHILANGGYLKSTANGNTLTMGSANAGWCHFSSSVKFHFSQAIWAIDGFHVTNAGGNDLGANYTKTECTVNNTNGKIGIFSSTNRGLYEYTDGKWIIYLQHSDDTVRSNYKIYGAVWNDYVEFREGDVIEGGYTVYDDGHGRMKLCTQRMQPGSRITSDTYGIAVGHTETAKTPIGVSGRVLAYPAQLRNNYKVGDAVCSAPGGKIDIMTREEIQQYPDRIIGIVSEVPDYDIWDMSYKAEEEKEATHTNIKINGRIWIYVR